VCVCRELCVCLYICVCVYIYIYICVCVCVCVWGGGGVRGVRESRWVRCKGRSVKMRRRERGREGYNCCCSKPREDDWQSGSGGG
jgi:hypothetical protein